MKYNNKKHLTFTKIFVLILCILICFQISFAAPLAEGKISHEIVTPYNFTASHITIGTYNPELSKQPTYTYINSGYNSSHKATPFYSIEPFCKFGGQYYVTVKNNAKYSRELPNESIYGYTKKFYYCKTTSDLLTKVKIPVSWSNGNLILYCNDGNLIYLNEYNLDFLTSRVNTYKICILKNLDLESNNTILYGFDVGNRLIDSNEINFFNITEKNGPIVQELTYESSNSQTSTQITSTRTIYVPYVEEPSCVENIQNNGGGGGGAEGGIGTQEQCPYVPDSLENATIYIQNECAANRLTCDSTTIIHISEDTANKKRVYSVQHDGGLSTQIEFVYKKDNRSYIFNYNSYNKFYILKEAGIPNLDHNLNLPNIGLSRIFLYKQITTSTNPDKIYGSESVLKDMNDNADSEIQPVYKIESLGITKDLCEKTLASYSPISSFSKSSYITCENNGNIRINAKMIDNQKGAGTAVNLFLNIVLGMYHEPQGQPNSVVTTLPQIRASQNVDSSSNAIQTITNNGQTIVSIPQNTQITLQGQSTSSATITVNSNTPTGQYMIGTVTHASQIYEFGPAGATFSTPITITLNYQAGLDPTSLNIYYLNATTSNWEIVTTGRTINADANSISVQVTHFSKYAVGNTGTSSNPTGSCTTCQASPREVQTYTPGPQTSPKLYSSNGIAITLGTNYYTMYNGISSVIIGVEATNTQLGTAINRGDLVQVSPVYVIDSNIELNTAMTNENEQYEIRFPVPEGVDITSIQHRYKFENSWDTGGTIISRAATGNNAGIYLRTNYLAGEHVLVGIRTNPPASNPTTGTGSTTTTNPQPSIPPSTTVPIVISGMIGMR